MRGRTVGLAILVVAVLSLTMWVSTFDQEKMQQPVVEPSGQKQIDCPGEFAASELVLTAARHQNNDKGASPRFSWIPLETVDGVSVATSANVYFSWNFEPRVSPDCTYHAGWVLLRSRNPEPIYSDQVYWYRSLGKYNFSRPNDLPSGTWYFRSCLGSYEPVGCSIYSNTIAVRIP